MRTKFILAPVLLAFAVVVNAENKPYITKVYDFMPAPGQFVNETPEWEEGDTKDDILAKVSQSICGYTKANGKIVIADEMVSLGSFGGYVVFGFDHPVVNVKGEYDLQILGNATFYGNDNTLNYGSSEPGIVMVSRDINGNGIPDDPWYELAGSEHNDYRTQHDFVITYYRPTEHTPMPDPDNSLTDTCYIAWKSNSIDSLQQGYVYKNSFHEQSYWPAWLDADSLTFRGTKLRGNAQCVSSSLWLQYFFDWGYVDNRPNYKYNYSSAAYKDGQNLGFKLDWAVDEDGKPVTLQQIDFVKVYNATLQECGWIGEASTEVAGAFDLHPDAVAEAVTGDVNGDGEVTVADVTEIYNVILGTSSQFAAQADINGDGEVTVADVTSDYNIILGEAANAAVMLH